MAHFQALMFELPVKPGQRRQLFISLSHARFPWHPCGAFSASPATCATGAIVGPSASKLKMLEEEVTCILSAPGPSWLISGEHHGTSVGTVRKNTKGCALPFYHPNLAQGNRLILDGFNLFLIQYLSLSSVREGRPQIYCRSSSNLHSQYMFRALDQP
jgi:hypothetical protein